MQNKKETWVFDLDGTLIPHEGYLADQPKIRELLPGVREFLDKIEKEEACIVIMTGRRESMREETVEQLKDLNIVYDFLVLGVNAGARHLVNDTKPDGTITAVGHPIKRNKGLKELYNEKN